MKLSFRVVALVILDRPAKKNVRGKRFQVAGEPISLRYIVVQLRDWNGKVLAEWMLLTNAPKCVHTEHLARCYYWRWRIEGLFRTYKRTINKLKLSSRTVRWCIGRPSCPC